MKRVVKESTIMVKPFSHTESSALNAYPKTKHAGKSAKLFFFLVDIKVDDRPKATVIRPNNCHYAYPGCVMISCRNDVFSPRGKPTDCRTRKFNGPGNPAKTLPAGTINQVSLETNTNPWSTDNETVMSK